jgi:RNA polymerase sigma-70 factor, ECF subfamily
MTRAQDCHPYAEIRDAAADIAHGGRFEREAVPMWDALFVYAMRLTQNVTDAEDLVQDTMVKAFARFDSFTEGTNLKAWLSRILVNSYINGYRRARRCPERLVDLQHPATPARYSGSSHSAETEALQSVLEPSLEDALFQLPQQFQEVLFYADVQGHSYAEIAALMNTPLGTVTSRLHRSRRRLREALSDKGSYRTSSGAGSLSASAISSAREWTPSFSNAFRR